MFHQEASVETIKLINYLIWESVQRAVSRIDCVKVLLDSCRFLFRVIMKNRGQETEVFGATNTNRSLEQLLNCNIFENAYQLGTFLRCKTIKEQMEDTKKMTFLVQ